MSDLSLGFVADACIPAESSLFRRSLVSYRWSIRRFPASRSVTRHDDTPVATMATVERPRVLRVLLVNDLAPGPTGGAEVHVGRLASALRSEGCIVELAVAQAPHVGWRRILDVWDPSSRRQLRRVVAEFRPDVVHYHNILNELSSSVVGLGVPSVVTVHDPRLIGIRFGPDQDDSIWAPHVLARAAKNRLARRRLRKCTAATIAPSASLTGGLRAAGFRSVHHIENFAPSTPCGLPGPDVVYLGSLQPHKGPQVLMAAWASVAAAHPTSTLRFIGDGPARGGLESASREAGLSDRVVFAGSVPPHEVCRHLRSAAMVVAPSLGVEGGGPTLAVIEAMAAGRPVVVSDRPGVSEGVDEQVGAVVPAGDASALAAAINRLLGDRDRLQRLGAAAADRAAERWAPKPAARRVIAVYEAILG